MDWIFFYAKPIQYSSGSTPLDGRGTAKKNPAFIPEESLL
jgi:hypothetical protein